MERVDLDVATEFLLIAATLVELKARRLLPGRDDIELDEELLRFEERDLLLARLLECKTFQDAARVDARRLVDAPSAARSRDAPGPRSRSVARARPARTGRRSTLLRGGRSRGLAPEAVEEVQTDHIAPIRASVRDAIETVLACCPSAARCSFRELTSACARSSRSIVRFLAVLELFKQGVVDLEQFESFGDLTVRRSRAGETALDAASARRVGRARARTRAGETLASEPMPCTTSSSTKPREPASRRGAPGDRGDRAGRDRAGAPAACSRSCSSCRSRAIEELCARARAPSTRRRPRLPARAGRRRLPLPDPPRPRAVRRAVRARRPDARACRARARDAGDRRVQATGLRGADLGDPRRERRRRR